MSSGSVVKLDLEGEDAVRRWRELLGPTNSEAARKEAPGSVRGGSSRLTARNALLACETVDDVDPLEGLVCGGAAPDEPQVVAYQW